MDRDDIAAHPRPPAGAGAHHADRGRRRLRLQARPVGAALHRARRLDDSSRPVRMVYTRPESMMSTTKRHPVAHPRCASAPTRDGRLAGDGLRRRFQHRRLCLLGSDGGQPRAGARLRPVLSCRTTARATRADPHATGAGRRLPRLRRAAGDDRAGAAVRRARRQARHRPAGVPHRQCAARRRSADGDRPGAGRRRRHPRLPRGAAAALAARRAPEAEAFNARTAASCGAASASPACGTAAATPRCPIPSTIRSASRRDGRIVAASGRGRYRPGLQHGDDADLRRRARRAARLASIWSPPTPTSRPTPARPRPRARPSSPARRPSWRAQALRAADPARSPMPARRDAAVSAMASVIVRDGGARARARSRRACPPMTDGYVLSARGDLRSADHGRSTQNGQGMPYAVYGFGAHLAEVEVDMELGTVKVLQDHRRPRRRPRHQSDAGRGPDRGRHRPGHRHGADGGVSSPAAPRTCTTI